MIKNIFKVLGIVSLILFTSFGVAKAECVSPSEIYELVEEVDGDLIYNLNKKDSYRLLEEIGFDPKEHDLSQVQVYGNEDHKQYMVFYYKDDCVHTYELIPKELVDAIMHSLEIKPLMTAEFN